MSREIQLHSVDIWNRATIADGKKLQATTIRPLSANDCILASAVSAFGAEIQQYIDTDYTFIKNTVDPDITKWNGTSLSVYYGKDNWNKTYDEVNNSSKFWNWTYNALGASAGYWNSMTGSACSGAAASGWLSKNTLPNNDATDDFNCLRPTAETDDQYKIAGGSIGKSNMFVAPWSAWSGTDKGPIFLKAHKTLMGDRNIVILPYTVAESAKCTNTTLFSINNSHVSGANNTVAFVLAGALNKNLSPQAKYTETYTHRDSNNSLLFVKGGSEDFTNTLAASFQSDMDLKNTFARGPWIQKVYDSTVFSYGVDYGYAGSHTFCAGTEIYDVHRSITNMKGCNSELRGGIFNTLNIKGTIWGVKGEGTTSPAQFTHSTWNLKLENSTCNNCESYNRLPYSAVKNSHVESYWRCHSWTTDKLDKDGNVEKGEDGKVLKVQHYDAEAGFDAKAINSYVLNDNTGPVAQDTRFNDFENTFTLYSKFNGRSMTNKNCYYVGDTYEYNTSISTPTKIEDSLLFTKFSKIWGAADSFKYKDSYLNFNDMSVSGNYYNNLILSMSATSTFTPNDIRNNIICGIYNMNMGSLPATLHNNLILFGQHGDWQEQGVGTFKNNLLELHNAPILNQNMFENSYVRYYARSNGTSKNTPYLNYYNSFVLQSEVSGFEMVGQYSNTKPKQPAFINTASATQTGYTTSVDKGQAFIVGRNLSFNSYYFNRFVFGEDMKFECGSVNSPTVMLFGSNINLKAHYGVEHAAIIGHNMKPFFRSGEPRTVMLGGRYDGPTSERMDSFKNSFPASWTGEFDESQMFMICDDVGPYFIVWGIRTTDTTQKQKYHGMYFYKNGDWYDVKSKTKLKDLK